MVCRRVHQRSFFMLTGGRWPAYWAHIWYFNWQNQCSHVQWCKLRIHLLYFWWKWPLFLFFHRKKALYLVCIHPSIHHSLLLQVKKKLKLTSLSQQQIMKTLLKQKAIVNHHFWRKVSPMPFTWIIICYDTVSSIQTVLPHARKELHFKPGKILILIRTPVVSFVSDGTAHLQISGTLTTSLSVSPVGHPQDYSVS